jgi:hypothetical protein
VYEQAVSITFGIIRWVIGLFIPARVWVIVFLALAIYVSVEMSG